MWDRHVASGHDDVSLLISHRLGLAIYRAIYNGGGKSKDEVWGKNRHPSPGGEEEQAPQSRLSQLIFAMPSALRILRFTFSVPDLGARSRRQISAPDLGNARSQRQISVMPDLGARL